MMYSVFKLNKQGDIIHTEYIVQNTRVDESQTGIMIARITNNNLRYADDTILMTEREEA